MGSLNYNLQFQLVFKNELLKECSSRHYNRTKKFRVYMIADLATVWSKSTVCNCFVPGVLAPSALDHFSKAPEDTGHQR